MNEEYPMSAKLSQLALEEMTDLKASPLNQIDSTWGYKSIYELLVYFQDRVDSTIEIVTKAENASLETDKNLNARLDQLIAYLGEVKLKLNCKIS